MNRNNTYGIEISDYRATIEDESKPVKKIHLDGWVSAEAAADAGWTIIETLAEMDGLLDCENQGDQFMAYYKNGVKDPDTGEDLAGIGAVTIQITNPDGTFYEDL